MVLDGIGSYWIVLDRFGWHEIILSGIKWFQIVLHSFNRQSNGVNRLIDGIDRSNLFFRYLMALARPRTSCRGIVAFWGLFGFGVPWGSGWLCFQRLSTRATIVAEGVPEALFLIGGSILKKLTMEIVRAHGNTR